MMVTMRTKHQSPKKRRKTSPEKKLSPKEYNDCCAKLSKSNTNDTCTLQENHKNHKIKDCNNLKRELTTSKESASSHEGMSCVQDETSCSETFGTSTLSRHIDLFPFNSLNNTVSSNILDDVTSSFMLNTKATLKADEELHKTIGEKVGLLQIKYSCQTRICHNHKKYAKHSCKSSCSSII